MHTKLTRTIFGLLLLQFVLGMLANLYATVPTNRPYDVFHQLGLINLHAINGTILLVLAIVLAVKARRTAGFGPAMGGLVNVVLAFTFGELFVFLHSDIYSFLMALAFLGALMSYARLVFTSKKPA